MKRVMYLITSSNFGGAETLLYQWVRALDRTRFTPMVCSIKTKGALALKMEAEGIPVESLELDLRTDLFHPLVLFRKIKKLSALIKTFRPDILHASLFQADVLSAVIGGWNRVPVRLGTVHMVLRDRLPEMFFERVVSVWMTRYVAVSEAIRQTYIRWLFLPSKKIEVVYNAVDAEAVKRRAEQTVPDLEQIDTNRSWLVMLGRIDPQKGLDTLVEAVRRMVKRNNVKGGVLLVGAGPDLERLKRRVQVLKLEDHIRFMGFQENPMPFLKLGKALVLSSLEEGLPVVILEAMALGKPIVATAVGAIPEIVKEGETGFLVTPKDVDGLAQAMEKILLDPVLAEKMGQKGELMVRERFSLGVIQRELENLYERETRK